LIQREHLQSRFYEPVELEIIRKFFSGGTFMDVGANVGNHSIFAGAVLGADELVAIEPNPITFRLLCANIALNDLMPRTLIYRVGLSHRDGSAEIEGTQPRNLGNTNLKPSESGSLELRNGDRLLNGKHIDFIKIDTEGMEIDVLKGLQDTIATCRPTMFVEVDHQNGDAFRAFLRRSGYVVRDQFSRYDSITNFLVSWDR
jgi:FkbM family methyltransferase